ncbi:MAG: zinc dependent phospholipase C family protein, partial [Terriglobales bacterium]
MHRLSCVLVFSLISVLAQGYSVLTHEAIIDAAWKVEIRPLLLERFPNATVEELKAAHAYAYGGA